MDQKLTFTAFLKDEYSKKFEKLADSTDKGIEEITKDLDKLGRTGKNVTRTIEALDKRINQLTKAKKLSLNTDTIRAANAEIKALMKERAKMDNSYNSGSSSWLGGMGKGFAIAGGIYAGGRFLKAGVSSSIEAAMQREQQRIMMSVLTGSKQRGDVLMNNIVGMAARTPFTTNDLLKSAQTQLGFGVNQNDVMGNMQRLGDISGGDVERFQNLTLAFSQMSSAGRLMGQDLLQMVNAGFNPLNEISIKTGKNMGVLRKEMEDGKISAEMVVAAMKSATGEGGRYFNLMEKQSQTTAGRISTLKDNVNETAVAIGNRFKPALDAAVDSLGNMIGAVKDWFSINAVDKVRDERSEINFLTSSITGLNQGNDVRKGLLNELVSTYPDLFGKIDTEKIKNSELLKILDDVNASYDRRIKMAQADEEYNTAKDNQQAVFKKAILANKALTAFQNGNVDLGTSLLRQSYGQVDLAKFGMNWLGSDYSKIDAERRVGELKIGMNSTSKALGVASSKREITGGAQRILDLAAKVQAGDKTIPKNIADEVMRQKGAAQAYMLGGADNAFIGYDFSKLNYGAGSIAGGGATASGSAGGGTSVPSISGGGRITNLTINIDGLVKGGITISNSTMKESATELKDMVTEALLSAVNDTNLVAAN